MTKSISTAAQKLIELEDIQRLKPLNDDQQQKWNDLVDYIFGPDVNPRMRRRSFRLKTNSKCRIRMNGNIFDGELIELNMLGFSSAVDLNQTISQGAPCCLESVQVQGEPRIVGLQCVIANIRVEANKIRFGAEILKTESTDVLRTYYDRVYYPCYIAFLNSLVTISQ